jgi:predicted DNA-binding transcriptional regulator YafY
MDQPKMDRLLRLMVILLVNNHLSNSQIAEKLGITERTVERYIETFRCAGFVVTKNDGYYSLDKSSPLFKEISEIGNFSAAEAVVLNHSIEGVDDPNLLKQNLKKKLEVLYHKRLMAEVTVNPQNADNVKVLTEAIRDKKQVILYDYASANSDKMSHRLVEPYKFTTNYIDVWCYELVSACNKLFKIARIGRSVLLQHDWDFETVHDTGFVDIFRMHDDCKINVRLRLNVRAAHLLLEEYPKSDAYLKEIEHDHWLLDTDVCSFLGIGRFVLGLMDDIEVIKPNEFVKYLKKQLKNSQIKLKN